MSAHIALIKGDGIGAAVCNVTTYLVDFCLRLVGKTPLTITKIDAGAAYYPDVVKSCNYVDAQALDLIRQPWDANILVMENLFGDISPNLAGGLVGGMGMTAWAEIGDNIGLFQPAHGSASDIMSQDRANPLAAILSGVMMLDYPADKLDLWRYAAASRLLDAAITTAFEKNTIRPMEFGDDMGTLAVTRVIAESYHPLQTSL